MRASGRWSLGAVLGLIALFVTGVATAAAVGGPPALAPSGGPGAGGCPSDHALGSFAVAGVVGASASVANGTASFTFSSYADLGPTNGVPGLIEYCVYPNGSLPSSAIASAVGADGSSFVAASHSAQGYFGFVRSNGDPSNLPLDGSLGTSMGTASWTGAVPSNWTILLHIHDAAECAALYGGSGSSTCFVLPGPAPSGPCGGEFACKSVVIAEATSTSPLTVPSGTLLHINYTYTIANPAGSGIDMEFLALGASNGTTLGVKDSFTCEQTVDPAGSPGAYGYYGNYSGTGLSLRLTHSANPSCDRPVLSLASLVSTVTLHPGQSFSFSVDMTTHAHGFTGHGTYCINAGLTVLWYEPGDGMVHAYHSPMVDVTVV